MPARSLLPPTDLLIVSSWFPAVDDSTKGRFVADQAQAVLSTGRYRPAVLSFETIGISGSAARRRSQIATIQELAGRSIRTDAEVFHRCGMYGPPGIPVARIPVAGGARDLGVADHASRHRAAALQALADRTDGPRWRLIHAHTGYPDGSGSAAFAAALGVPLVITEHASFVKRILGDPAERRAYVAGVNAAARFIAVSHTLGNELAASIPEVASKLVVIPNAVDVDAFRAPALSARRPDELLYVGYRTKGKGVGMLLTAFREVHAARPTTTLRLVGGSPTAEIEAGWHRMAVELGVDGAVRFDPPALRAGVADAMSQASILVHASPRETFGMTAVEALASGLPVVAVDNGGITETLGPDPTALGELVPVADASAFAAAILRTLDRRATFDPQRLRSSVVSRFGAASIGDRLADLYDEITLPSDGSRRAPTRSPRASASRPGVGTGSVHEPGGNADRPAGPTLVVGFTTSRTARQLAPLSASILTRCRVIFASGPAAAALPAGIMGLVSADIDGPYRDASERLTAGGPRGSRVRRILRALRDPLGVVRRRRLRAKRGTYQVAASQRAAADEVASLRPTDGRRVEILAIDGIDYVAVAPLLESEVRLLPGSVRWLADRAAAET